MRARPRPAPHVEYPESDGKPMAETDTHRDLMIYLIEALRRRFRSDPGLYVTGNLFLYFEEGNPGAVVAPDVFVVRGVPAGNRRTYKVWVEGKAPDLVIELTSRSTHLEDLGNKRAVYEAIGVREYYIFDPEGDRFDPAFRAFWRRDGALRPVLPAREEAGKAVFVSEVLGLELHGGGSALTCVDPETGAVLPSTLELEQALEATARRAEQEAHRAEAAEAELGRLHEELARRSAPPRGPAQE